MIIIFFALYYCLYVSKFKSHFFASVNAAYDDRPEAIQVGQTAG